MNPGKMRNTYGKLMWILMDTESYAVKEKLQVRIYVSTYVRMDVCVHVCMHICERMNIQDNLPPGYFID